jgi:hypothetical protein
MWEKEFKPQNSEDKMSRLVAEHKANIAPHSRRKIELLGGE